MQPRVKAPSFAKNRSNQVPPYRPIVDRILCIYENGTHPNVTGVIYSTSRLNFGNNNGMNPQDCDHLVALFHPMETFREAVYLRMNAKSLTKPW